MGYFGSKVAGGLNFYTIASSALNGYSGKNISAGSELADSSDICVYK